jgi:superfamily II DNA or RNA helicase
MIYYKHMKPLKHQQRFLDQVKSKKYKKLVVWEGGTGKTIAGCLWLKDGRDEFALVICPKRVVKKWQETLKLWGTRAVVLSKEEFKKFPKKNWSAIVVDEADEFASPLFVKGRSQLSATLYEIIREYNPEVLCLTATPIRSNPWNLHTLLTFTGNYIDWKKWRDHFFELGRRPYLPRPAWLPRSDWRKRIVPILEKHADIVLLKDCIADVPSKTSETIKLKAEPYKSTEEWEPTKAFFEEHRHEQKNKLKHVLEIAKNYRKVLVVAYYVEQVESLAKELSKDRQTFMVHGGTKRQEEILKEANTVDECFLVCQASLGSGFDANTFSCVIFVSMSYAVRDFVQMGYRVRRIHDLHPVKFYHLVAGRCDKAILDNVNKGRNFIPSEWPSL